MERVDRPVNPWRAPRWCLTPDEMAAVDQRAVEAGLPGMALMETAGRAVADAVDRRWPHGGRVVVLAGGGNNGGDGLVAARVLASRGWAVELELLADPRRLSCDAGRQWALVEPPALASRRVVEVEEAGGLAERVVGATCVVDALLGTGLSGDVREPIRSALEALARSDIPVVAVDAPSGLNGATGVARGVATRADLTVTFGFPKPGLFLADGPERVGVLVPVDLGYPPGCLAAAGPRPLEWIGLAEARRALPRRRHDAHKGSAGRLVLVAGSERFRGAALLAAGAALRSGVGMCVVAAPEGIAEFLVGHRPEAIVEALPADAEGGLAAEAAERLTEILATADAVALGPGLTTEAGVRAVVAAALDVELPAVVDADALNVLADDPRPARRGPPTVLTPHPGELGRWLDRPAADVDRDRLAAAREAARRWESHVVLKGSPTVVAAPSGETALNLTGGPALATGGSGDVLTGLLGSLLAQGVDAATASRAAPFLHGLAGDRAARDRGDRGVLPSDLVRVLPIVVREIVAGRGATLIADLRPDRAALLAAERGGSA